MKKMFKVIILALFTVFISTAVCTNSCTRASEVPSDNITSVRASHILVDTKDEADLIREAIEDGAGFTTMAKKYSKCPSGQNGGDLGYFERGQMVKEFEDVTFELPVGKVSKPVHTQFGWHLIKVLDRK